MRNKQNNAQFDKDFDKKMRYINLKIAKWEIESELRHEFPEKMWYSDKRFAEMILNAGLIKCKHEE